jgi:NADH oxidase (H2O2-forming)
MKAPQQIVIIGNGIAGNSAAEAIRKFNPTARVTLVSDEKHPLYSPCAFHKYFSGDLDEQKLFLKKFEHYPRLGIHALLGKTVSEIDLLKREVCVDSMRIPFAKLILATGSKASLPPFKGIEKQGVFTFKTLKDARKIFSHPAKKVVVVGSGPTGIEAAVGLRKKGLKVILLSRSRILRKLFDEEAAILLKSALERGGIEVFMGEQVSEIIGKECVEGLATNKRTLICDMVIMSSGVHPNVELARASGLEIGKLGGIKTDGTLMTNAEEIYACGDCIESKDMITGEVGLSLRWPNAKRQGFICGCNCVGQQKRFTGSFNVTALEIFGTYAFSAGVGASSPEGKKLYETTDAEEGTAYTRLVMKGNCLVGMQLINNGEQGGLLLSRMLRKDNLLEAAREVRNDKVLSRKPWNYWMKHYSRFCREIIPQ